MTFFSFFSEYLRIHQKKKASKEKKNKTANKRERKKEKKEKHIIKTVRPSGKSIPEQRSYYLNESHSQCQVTLESNTFTVILRKEAQ